MPRFWARVAMVLLVICVGTALASRLAGTLIPSTLFPYVTLSASNEFDLFVIDLQRRLTIPLSATPEARDCIESIAPDVETLIYTIQRWVGGEQQTAVMLYREGRTIELDLPNRHLERGIWLPDSARYVLQDRAEVVTHIVEANTGTVTRYRGIWLAANSGEYLLRNIERERIQEIEQLNLLTGIRSTVLTVPFNAVLMRISPSGRYALYSNRQLDTLFLLGLETGDVREFALEQSRDAVAWSADDQWVVFESRRMIRLWNHVEDRWLAFEHEDVQWGGWSPDGRYALIMNTREDRFDTESRPPVWWWDMQTNAVQESWLGDYYTTLSIDSTMRWLSDTQFVAPFSYENDLGLFDLTAGQSDNLTTTPDISEFLICP
jgi:hypothetical protein